ncbi:RHS repeat-associated core domain-containing protein [Flavobacterium lipolyticum]|uniref:RHS repeat domain-containing protein n=1 Tax=Flavobacterium lipolyticum TaxID=2893754 RepID=UPI003204A23A
MSYTKNPVTQVLNIVDKNNYYPFGLKHKGYNDYVAASNKYKFNGKELQDELSLNWDSFKWRNYDYAIGRFMCIDPLAEKYSYQSPYNFAENKVISHRELEGLEGIWFQAVMNADKAANPNGVSAHVMGISQGLVHSAKGLINSVAHPVEIAKGIGNAALWVAVGSQGSSALDKVLGTNSTGAGNALLNGVVSGGNKLVNGNGSQRGEVIGEIAGAVIGAKGMGAATKALSAAGKTTSLFRAVSNAELSDIASNGLRTTAGGYETSKLFATSAENAAQFGKLNYGFDGIPNTIIEAKVPNSVMGTTTSFTADGMSAVAVPAEQLQNIKKVIPSNSSPIGN